MRDLQLTEQQQHTPTSSIAHPGYANIHGLSQADDQTYGIYRIGNSVYVARTKRIRHVYDDWKLLLRQTSHSERHQTLKQYLDANPEVGELLEDSLGGSVMLEPQSNFYT